MSIVTAGKDFLCHFADDLACITLAETEDESDETSFQRHLEHLDILFGRLAHSGLKLSPKKCNWAYGQTDSMKWLGHEVSSLYMKPQEAKVKAVKDFPVPTTPRQALSFISMASFYRQYIEAFAIYASPIYRAIKSDPFEWHPAAQTAFEALKVKMCSHPVLKVIDPNLDFIMYCDASGIALACVLEQHDPKEPKGHPVAYASRQFSKDEIRLLSSPAKELCSILYGVTLWSALIAGAKIIVKTDCICWSYLALASATSNRMSRLGLILSEHNILIEHIPGTQNKASDGLSRAFDATTQKVDSYKINKDERVEFLTAPKPLSKDPMPLADYMHQCTQHLQSTWPPAIPDAWNERGKGSSFGRSIKLVSNLWHSLRPEGAPTDEQEFINRVIQPVNQHSTLRLTDIACDPTINVMTPAEAKCFHPQATQKADRIALVAMNETAFTPQAFAALQSTDDDLKHIKKQLQDPATKYDRKSYFMQNGIIMHEYADHNGMIHPTVCVPQELIPLILQSYHVTVLGGHQSKGKIEKDLKRKYYWPRMKSTIKKHCDACLPCSYNQRYPVGFTLGRLITPLYPNHIVFMDITGGLPKSYDGCTSLLLLYDGFSKFAFGIPLKQEKAAYVAKLFVQQYVQAFGVPFALHSDNAPNMAGAIMSWICRMLACKKTETPSWCPRADPAECLVSAVGDLLRKHMGKSDQRMWPVILPFIINGLNATVSSSTLFTPSEIFLGRAIENTPVPLLPGNHPEITADAWMLAVRRGQEYKYETIRKRARALKTKRQQEINETRRTHHFNEGDFVMCKDFTPALKGEKKLRNKFRGPMRIIKAMTSSLIVIPWTEEHKFGDFGLEADLFQKRFKGSAGNKPIYYELVSTKNCKPYKGPIGSCPEYDPLLVDRFLDSLGVDWDKKPTPTVQLMNQTGKPKLDSYDRPHYPHEPRNKPRHKQPSDDDETDWMHCTPTTPTPHSDNESLGSDSNFSGGQRKSVRSKSSHTTTNGL